MAFGLFTSGATGQPVANPANGHWYERIDAPGIDWFSARLEAASRSHAGLPGHLASISSTDEQQFVASQVLSGTVLDGHWIGGFQDRTDASYAEPQGGWKWVTGEPWGYACWGGGEPNNVGGNEDWALMRQPLGGTWNDLFAFGYNAGNMGNGYIVEYESPQGPLIFHVSLSGNDLSDGGSWLTPKRTIGGAIASASSGDEVWVAAGVYEERIVLKEGVRLFGGFSGTEVERSARDWRAHVSVLDGQAAGVVVSSPAGVTSATCVDGFSIRNGFTDVNGINGPGVWIMYSSPVIANNTITDNRAPLNYNGGGGVYCFRGSPLIQNNIIKNNVAGYGGGGVWLDESAATVVGNTIVDNVGGWYGGGVSCWSHSNATVANNVIARNSASNGAGVWAAGSSVPQFVNNTIVGNTGGPVVDTGGAPGVLFGNNILAFNDQGFASSSMGSLVGGSNCFFSTGGVWPVGPGDVFADPRFANPVGDYRLLTGSPGIDAGNDAYILGGWPDVAGAARIHGAHVDIGAYEHVNTAPIANAGQDRSVPLTSPSGASVVLDGSGSYDPDNDSLTYSWTGPFPEGGGTVTGLTPTVTLPLGVSTINLTVSDGSTTSQDTATIAVFRRVDALGSAQMWIGLKNSDDVGTKFDLLAEVYLNGDLIGSGTATGVPGGSSGFNNAVRRAIALSLSSMPEVTPGDALAFKLSARIAASSGHRSGTARLWFNDAAANSLFEATIGQSLNSYHLLAGSALGTSPGSGPRSYKDVFVDRAQNGNAWKPFGTWGYEIP